jgi:A/G-specific adenine glycosylase
MSLADAPPQRNKVRKAVAFASAGRVADLLAWYDWHRRVLPWRAERGKSSDSYRVWLSEIMLQQTTVKAVGPYFLKFIERWPTVDALGAASLDDVLRLWAGLGYYSRARNLHACAVAVMRDHGGLFPDSEDGLRALPGIGAYTAAAIASIAFNRPTMPVDGNLPADDRLCGTLARRCRDLSTQGAEKGRRATARRGLRHQAWRCHPAANAARKGPARRHERSAKFGMARRPR